MLIPHNPLMVLNKKRIISFKPFLIPEVYIWNPDLILPANSGIRCLKCKERLGNQGWSTPRPILDVDKKYYLVSKRYICQSQSCRATYTGSDAEFLAQLPKEVSCAFPAILSKRGAISKLLGDLILSLDEKATGPSAIRSTILELHAKRYDEKRVMYYGCVATRMDHQAENPSIIMLTGDDVPIFPEFDEYCSVPSSNFFRDRFVKLCESMKDFWDFCVHRLDSKILKADHTFRVRRVFNGIDCEKTGTYKRSEKL